MRHPTAAPGYGPGSMVVYMMAIWSSAMMRMSTPRTASGPSGGPNVHVARPRSATSAARRRLAEPAQQPGQRGNACGFPPHQLAAITLQPGIQRLHQPGWASRATQSLIGEEQAVIRTLDAIPRPQRGLRFGHRLDGIDKAGESVQSENGMSRWLLASRQHGHRLRSREQLLQRIHARPPHRSLSLIHKAHEVRRSNLVPAQLGQRPERVSNSKRRSRLLISVQTAQPRLPMPQVAEVHHAIVASRRPATTEPMAAGAGTPGSPARPVRPA